jgi:predicted aspartyl protease
MHRCIAAAVVFCAVLGARGEAASGPPFAVVPYSQNGKLIALTVRVNASRPLRFVFDTGARSTVIDAAVARSLGLRTIAQDRGAGAGRGTFAEAHAAPLDVSFGAIRLRVDHPLIIDLRTTGTRDPIAGLIGVELLHKYVVRIDPLARTMTLYDPAHFAYAGTGAAVALRSVENRLYVPMKLALDGGDSVLHQLRVDTGSEDAASDNFVRRSRVLRTTLQGVGLGTPYRDVSGVFASVQIGPYVLRNAWGPSNDNPAVGMEILRRFTLTFDLPANRLYLEPNAAFTEPIPSPAP